MGDRPRHATQSARQLAQSRLAQRSQADRPDDAAPAALQPRRPMERRPQAAACRSSKKFSSASPTAKTNTRWPSWPTSPRRNPKACPRCSTSGRALEFYGTSLVHAYRYLFDYKDDLPLNAYDPQFRGASDLYNQSLEGMLRLGAARGRAAARHVAHHSHVEPHLLVRRRDALQRLARRRLRPLRVRQRLSGPGPAKPLPHLRPGRAVDRRPPTARRRRPGRAILSAKRELSADGLPARVVARGRGAGQGGVSSRKVFDAPPLAGSDAKLADPAGPRGSCSSSTTRSNSRMIDVAGRRVPLEADLSTPLAYFPQPAAVPGQQALDRRPAEPGRGQGAAGPLHARAVRPGQDAGRDGPRPLVEPRHLDGDVQRSAERSAWSATTTSSGSTSIRPASRSGSAARRCAKTWP